MKERGLIFSDQMVQAILSGKKTQTRRPVTNKKLENFFDHIGNPPDDEGNFLGIKFVKNQDRYSESGRKYLYTGLLAYCSEYPDEGYEEINCPYGILGERLYVRESFRYAGSDFDDDSVTIEYRDGEKKEVYLYGQSLKIWSEIERTIKKSGIPFDDNGHYTLKGYNLLN